VKPTLLYTTLSLSALLISGCVTDCSLGHYDGHETVVTGRYHKPAWTEVETIWVSGTKDHPGHYRTETTRHPDEFYLFTGDGLRIMVSSGDFHTIQDGKAVIARQRVGKFTGWHYGWSVVRFDKSLEARHD
jgi:hypothetical protein